jgi:hypothetical protein
MEFLKPLPTALVMVLLAAFLLGSVQQIPVPMTQQPNGVQVTPERDRDKEEEVAKLFEAIRSESKLPPLKRIKHRAELEQRVCTVALTGERSKGPSALYTTTDPQSPTPELKTIASSNRIDRYHPGRSVYERYSVAVWRTKESPSGNTDDYWVGVGLYGSASGEFVDCHFTDDVHYCGMWKESIARSCRGK